MRRSQTCPVCGDRVSGIDISDGEECLEPCGHQAPTGLRKSVSESASQDLELTTTRGDA